MNSPQWDFAGRFSPDGATFFFSSNRPRRPDGGHAAALRGREGYRLLLDEVRSPGNRLFNIYSIDTADLDLASPCVARPAITRAP